MKNIFMIVALLMYSGLSRADLGSAEIILLKTDYSFDFISLQPQGSVLLNNDVAQVITIDSLIAAQKNYLKVCYDGPQEQAFKLLTQILVSNNTLTSPLSASVVLVNSTTGELLLKSTLAAKAASLEVGSPNVVGLEAEPVQLSLRPCEP